MKPVSLDVIAPIPDVNGLCISCELMMSQANLGAQSEARRMDTLPREWLEDYDRLIHFVNDLLQGYENDIHMRVFDPRSIQGIWKSLRFGIRRYPTFIVAGSQKITGLDKEQVTQALNQATRTWRDSARP